MSVLAQATHLLRTERQRFGLLLFLVVAVFTLEGVARPGRWEQVIVTVVLAATLMLALWVAEAKAVVIRIALVISIAVVCVSFVQAGEGIVEGTATRLANALLVFLAPPAIAIGVVRNLRARQAVTTQAVLGVLSVYILLGLFFAHIYGAIDHLGGAPFFAGGQEPTLSHCLYYSFTTLTTVGYGDFTARSNLGHTLSVSEALVGQIYLVTIVSLIVGNMSRRPRNDVDTTTPP